MKRILVILLCLLCFTGCNATETMETISDDLAVSADATAAEIAVSLTGEEAALFCGEDGSKLYLCDGYCVMVQTLQGGDVAKSVQTVTGFSKENLTVMQTEKDGIISYEYVWCTAGEGEDQICRGVLLDDGAYHYAVTVMADYTQAGQLQSTWEEVLNSVEINTD